MINDNVNAIRSQILNLDKASNNIANVNTKNFDNFESFRNKNKNDPIFSSITKDIVELLKSEKLVGYNVKSIQTQNEMLGNLLDIKS